MRQASCVKQNAATSRQTGSPQLGCWEWITVTYFFIDFGWFSQFPGPRRLAASAISSLGDYQGISPWRLNSTSVLGQRLVNKDFVVEGFRCPLEADLKVSFVVFLSQNKDGLSTVICSYGYCDAPGHLPGACLSRWYKVGGSRGYTPTNRIETRIESRIGIESNRNRNSNRIDNRDWIESKSKLEPNRESTLNRIEIETRIESRIAI